MGKISGLTKDMSSGKINPGQYQFSETHWEEAQSKQGQDQIFATTTLLDRDGAPHPLKLFCMSTTAYGSDERIVEINSKGQLVAIGGANVKINSGIGAGKFFASLEKVGFPPTILANVDTQLGKFDGIWVELDTIAQTGGKVDNNGNPYTDLVAKKLVEGPKGSGGAAAAKKTTTKPAAATEPEEEETTEEETSDDDATDDNATEDVDFGTDEEVTAAVEYVAAVSADPKGSIKNYLANADGSGEIALKQLSEGTFGNPLFKGKGALKMKVSKIVGNPEFHTHYDTDGWDSEDGVVRVAAKKSSGGGKGKK